MEEGNAFALFLAQLLLDWKIFQKTKDEDLLDGMLGLDDILLSYCSEDLKLGNNSLSSG